VIGDDWVGNDFPVQVEIQDENLYMELEFECENSTSCEFKFNMKNLKEHVVVLAKKWKM